MYSDSQLNTTTQILETTRGGGDQSFSFSSNAPTVLAPDDFKEKRFCRGDANPSDGRIFWCYQSNGNARWLTPDNYAAMIVRAREIDARYRSGQAYANNKDGRRANHKKYATSERGRKKIVERENKRRVDPKHKQRRLEYAQRPEVIERRKRYDKSPERQEARRLRYERDKQDPAWRAKRREQDRKRRERMEALGIKRKTKRKPYSREAYLARRAQNEQFILTSRIRSRVYQAIRNGRGCKQSGTEDLVGCSFDFLRQHIERQFTGRMSWDNPKSFHIDHIVPVSSFDFTDPSQVKVACNWQNLRPIPPKKNMSKGAKLIEPQLPLPLTVHSTTTNSL